MFLEEFLVFSFDNLNVEISGFSLDDGLSRKEDILINEKFGSITLMKVISHVKGLTTSAGLIKKRSVTNLETSEFLNYSLIIKERFKSSLGNLCLIWCVRSVPKISKKLPVGIFKNVSEND
jgi:hypothetical protein